MGFVTMTLKNATMKASAGHMFSPLTTSWKSRGSGSLTAEDVKDLNAFINDKVNKMLKGHNNELHMMSNFKELLISSGDESIEIIVSGISAEASDNKDSKLAAKK
eukprot:546408-Ditylum_brightwellii.AAC.1